MKRIVDLSDSLAERLDIHLSEHPNENFYSLVQAALKMELVSKIGG